MTTKICTKCKIEKELKNFNRQARSKDGYQQWCKKCKAEHKVVWRDNTKDHQIEYNTNYLYNSIVNGYLRSVILHVTEGNS